MSPEIDILSAVEELRPRVGDVQTGIILGSGLGAAAQKVVDQGGTAIPYSSIPGMPETKVIGHEGRLVVGEGRFAGVVFLQGRVHSYEGHSIHTLTFATRLLAALGMQNLIVSNAAGGIQQGYQPGDLMLIDGHWTLCDVQERNEETESPQPFRSDSNPIALWSPALLQLAGRIPSDLTIHQGTYAMMSGPNYETPAEIRMLRGLGCQAVGMSTIPEALAAAKRGVEVLGMSCITNVAAGLSEQTLDHEEVAETAGAVQEEFVDWLFRLLDELAGQPSTGN